MSDIQTELLERFSANFNDGEPIESRYDSHDMFSASVIVDFIKDFAVPYIASHDKEVERLARLDELSNIYSDEADDIRTGISQTEYKDRKRDMYLDERIAELQKGEK